MTRQRLLSAAALGVVAAATASTAAGAPPRYGTLPSPSSPIRAEPPLRPPASAAAQLERRFPKHVRANQLVRVTLGPNGRARRVVVVDRLLVEGTGDYSLAIPAPVEDVTMAAGSEAQPGLRSGAVLWQGFATRDRTLAASILLDSEAARRGLPIRVAIRDDAVVLENATTVSTSALASRAPAGAVARVLDAAHLATRRGLPFTAPSVPISEPLRTAKLRATFPLELSGSYRFADAPARRFRSTLGDEPLRLAGAGALERLEIRIAAPDPALPLRAPGARSWRRLAARGGLRRDAVAVAARRLVESALAVQFRTFLANPDPIGTTSTSYTFGYSRSVRETLPARDGGGGGPWLAVGLLLALGVGTVTALVAWAHS